MVGFEAFDAVAGGETAGIAFALGWQTGLACRCNMSGSSRKVRPQRPDRRARFKDGQRVLLVET